MMKSMFGIDYNSHWLKYNALSGLDDVIFISAGLRPTFMYNIPLGLLCQVPKGLYIHGLYVNPTRLTINVKSPERAIYNKV